MHTNIDREPTTRFLKLLDPEAKHFTFQTFHDKKPPTKPKLARIVESPARDELLQLHAHGAGIYVTVNQTDGKGRKAENVVRVRAVFQEDDSGHGGPFPLEPSLIVETSPGHFHRYWLTDDWPADEQGRKDFAAVMERMVESNGSDKNAKDIVRVLRVPGFLHRKNETHLVQLVEASGKRYSRAEILAAFPPVEREKKKEASPTGLLGMVEQCADADAVAP
jgi:RepB DNA-primase from phage plasmid